VIFVIGVEYDKCNRSCFSGAIALIYLRKLLTYAKTKQQFQNCY